MFGRIPWAELFTPSIRVLRDGFIVSGHLANAIQSQSELILTDPNMRLVFEKQIQIIVNDRVSITVS